VAASCQKGMKYQNLEKKWIGGKIDFFQVWRLDR
jgi:hypothetical protein